MRLRLFGNQGEKARCDLCGSESEDIGAALGVCLECIRADPDGALQLTDIAHREARAEYGLPAEPPREGLPCKICVNECRIGEGGKGYCGIRYNEDGRIKTYEGTIHSYYDRLPTNCCASWFCGACDGYNLAVFPYGCTLNCMFCQNASHKEIEKGEKRTQEQLVDESKSAECVCYFGGTPEPQLPFLLKISKRMLKEKPELRICWEWNGTGNPSLVKEAVSLADVSGGCVKFDLKAYDTNLYQALTGRPNARTLENFRMVPREFPRKDLLTATTLLVPGYIDAREVDRIAEFVASLNPDIPYSLLAFHPDFKMMDMPATSREQMDACEKAARKHLERVNVGNKHLLW